VIPAEFPVHGLQGATRSNNGAIILGGGPPGGSTALDQGPRRVSNVPNVGPSVRARGQQGSWSEGRPLHGAHGPRGRGAGARPTAVTESVGRRPARPPINELGAPEAVGTHGRQGPSLMQTRKKDRIGIGFGREDGCHAGGIPEGGRGRGGGKKDTRIHGIPLHRGDGAMRRGRDRFLPRTQRRQSVRSVSVRRFPQIVYGNRTLATARQEKARIFRMDVHGGGDDLLGRRSNANVRRRVPFTAAQAMLAVSLSILPSRQAPVPLLLQQPGTTEDWRSRRHVIHCLVCWLWYSLDLTQSPESRNNGMKDETPITLLELILYIAR
jgi:hypothetical protein